MTHTPATPEGTQDPENEDSTRRTEHWNYTTFVTQGIIANSAKAIGSPRLLMPYLYVATGSPVFLAGMLMPIVSISRLIGQVVTAPAISAANTRKWFLFAGWMMTALGLAAAGLSAKMPIQWLVMIIFVTSALALGFAKGLNGLAFNDLMSLNLSKARRNSGVFFMSAAGGVVTIGVTYFMYRFTTSKEAVDHYVNLALAAASITALAALTILFFVESKTDTTDDATAKAKKVERKPPKKSLLQRLEKLPAVLQFSWFRRYLWMRCLTATVIVAMPFYAVHGATHHAHKHAAGLSAFVIATSVAVILCGPFWRWLGKRSQRLSIVVGSGFVALAGIWALVIENVETLQTVFAHSFVFAFAAAGIQGVNGSRMLYLIDAAPKQDLTYFVAVSNTVSAILSLIVASIFGYIAEVQGVHWPVALVIVLNIFAAVYALTLSEPKTA